ncbi:MAG: histidine kinase N-terminal 7TM domain-containing protein [bacterium]|nr:histidine kinase N-terminal 7TM domain-containing protein [bacterium]
MNSLTYFKFSALFNFFSSCLIGLFVLSKNRKKTDHIYFALFSGAVAFWAINYFFWINSRDYRTAIFFCRGLTLGSTSFAITYFHFIIHYLDIFNRKKKLLYAGYFFWFIFIAGTFTPLMIKSLRPVFFFPFWPVPGLLYAPYLLYFLVYSYYACYLLFRRYHYESGVKKSQIRWILLGIAVGLTGGSTNYLLWYHINLLPYGNILVSIFPVTTGYAIIRYKAMEIDTVIHRTILWISSLVILIIPVGILYALVQSDVFSMGLVPVSALISVTLLFFLFYYNRLKPGIDHFFRRKRYDYQMVLAEMPSRIGSSLDLDSLSRNLFRELANILYVRNALFLIKPVGKDLYEEFGSTGYDRFLSGRTSGQKKGN